MFYFILSVKGTIHIGTSGWSYKHWKDIFYPPKLKTTEWLTFYAQHFSISEINTCFYHLPKPASVIGWIEKVPAHFKFCPKMSRYLTHIKRLLDPEEPLERFFEVFEPMKKRMGPVLIQLPPTLRFDYDRTEFFYSILKRKYRDYEFVMEVRHDSWLQEKSLTLMTKYDLGFVLSQSGAKFPYSEMITAKNIYVRFHGPSALYASSYSDAMLQEFAKKFRRWKKEGHDIWVFFNNDIGGYAIEDAKRLIGMLEK
ncbi:MAG TPA: DUF72 domain-containing protein [Flavisolibacter sp.]|nr:DUF72 domain-containing protein [Flavisolibacter sp.]